MLLTHCFAQNITSNGQYFNLNFSESCFFKAEVQNKMLIRQSILARIQLYVYYQWAYQKFFQSHNKSFYKCTVLQFSCSFYLSARGPNGLFNSNFVGSTFVDMHF